MLFVTSFNRDLYEATGKKLVDSFLKKQLHGRLLICFEDVIDFPVDGRLTLHNLGEDAFLKDWLTDNHAFIPDHLGGAALECSCPNHQVRHAVHTRGCHWSWMNRNASRWFRKVASLHHAAASNLWQDLMVWVDSDAYFLKELSSIQARRILKNHGMAFCKGHREAIESGVVLYDRQRGGDRVVKELCRLYTSGRYHDHHRWDDGFQLGVAAAQLSRYCLDLVHPTRWKRVTNNVIPKTELANYFVHIKGAHSRDFDLMK